MGTVNSSNKTWYVVISCTAMFKIPGDPEALTRSSPPPLNYNLQKQTKTGEKIEKKGNKTVPVR